MIAMRKKMNRTLTYVLGASTRKDAVTAQTEPDAPMTGMFDCIAWRPPHNIPLPMKKKAKPICPIRSSTALPNGSRKIMLPSTCHQLACIN